MNKYKKTIRAYKIFLIMVPIYILLGTVHPGLMAKTNDLLMHTIYTTGYAVLNTFLQLAIGARNLWN